MQKRYSLLYHVSLWCCLLLPAGFLFSCGGKAEQPTVNADGGESPLENLRRKYAHARALQRERKYSGAIPVFKDCLTTDARKEKVCDSLMPIVTEALMQLMNIYQSMGEPETCADYLDSLRRHPTHLIRNYCLRDLYSIAAYALSRTDRTAEAERLVDSVQAMKLYHPTPERLFRDYAYSAAICFGNPDRQEQVMEWSRKALEQAKLCGNTSGVQYVTSMLGQLYRRRGQLSDAIDLYLESSRQAQERGDKSGEATACNALAELYLYWDIPTYANIYVSQAIALNEKHTGSNPMISVQSLLLKGQIMLDMEHPDSALHYYGKAETICHSLPYTSGQADADYLNGTFRIERCTGDSLKEGMERLQRVVAEGTPLLRAKACYSLAEGHFKQRQTDRAEALLDSMHCLLHSFNPPQYIEVNYEWVLRHFLKKKDLQHVEQYVLDLIEECKFNFNSDICTKMYDNIVDLKTKEEKQKLYLEQMELENERLYYRIWIFASLAVLLPLLVWGSYKRKTLQIKRQLMAARLSSLMDKLEEAQRSKEKTEHELSEMTVYKEKAEQELSALITNQESRKQIEVLIPSVLHEEGEDSFRQRFELLYPHFLPALRNKVPSIGRKEELLCMLIALKQDTHQTAVLMGIAYKSANMARYRLRQKAGLDTNDSLEEFIEKLADKQ